MIHSHLFHDGVNEKDTRNELYNGPYNGVWVVAFRDVTQCLTIHNPGVLVGYSIIGDRANPIAFGEKRIASASNGRPLILDDNRINDQCTVCHDAYHGFSDDIGGSIDKNLTGSCNGFEGRHSRHGRNIIRVAGKNNTCSVVEEEFHLLHVLKKVLKFIQIRGQTHITRSR